VSRVGCGLSCPGSRVTLLLRSAASGRASDKAIICQHVTDPHVYQMSLNSHDGAVISKHSDIVVQSPPSDMSLPVDRPLRPIACRSRRDLTNNYI